MKNIKMMKELLVNWRSGTTKFVPDLFYFEKYMLQNIFLNLNLCSIIY